MRTFNTSTLSINVLTLDRQENEVDTLIFLINNSLIDHKIFKWCSNVGTGKRQNQNYLPNGCTAKLRLNYQSRSNRLVITTLNNVHGNHPKECMKSKLKISPKNAGNSVSNSGTLQITLLTEIWPLFLKLILVKF